MPRVRPSCCPVARAANVPNSLRKGPFRGSEAVRRGIVTKRQLRSSAWCRLFHDVYLHAAVPMTHALLCRAVQLLLPNGAAISGGSAAFLYGANVLQRDAPVEVTLPPRVWLRTQPGIVVRHSELPSTDIVSRMGIRATSPVRTGFDLARRGNLEDAVVAVDALLTTCGLTLDEISAYAHDRRSSWHGAGHLATVLSLAAVGAESPMESRLRLVLVRAGLPPPALQYQVWNEIETCVARLDLAYVDARLGVEYDGECHWEPRAVRKDLLRQNALRALSWSLLRFTAEDVLRHQGRVVAQVRSALQPGSLRPFTSPLTAGCSRATAAPASAPYAAPGAVP